MRKTMERAAAALALTSAQSARRLQNGLSLSRFLRKVLPNVKESLLSGRSDRAAHPRRGALGELRAQPELIN
jgi:hypothetical protein